MPKYGVHEHVLAQSMLQLSSGSAAAQGAANNLSANRAIGMLGAVGPDLLFWAPDYEPVDKLYRLYKNIEELVGIYNRVVEPIRQVAREVGEPVEDAVESLAPATVSLVRQLVERARAAAVQFQQTIATGLFTGVISGFNFLTDITGLPQASTAFFDLFVPPLQNNEPIGRWYWFDMLHYRRTGAYAKSLVSRADTARKKAYAYGYLSHVATDVLGHAYVNQIVGGPYRLNVQRHVTVENFMDAWVYDSQYSASVNGALLTRLGLPAPADLPDEIVVQINGALRDTYQTLHPTRLPAGFLSQAQLRQTYDTFYQVLRIMAAMQVARPEEPFSGVADVLSAALDDLLEAPPSPPSPASGACPWDDILSFGLSEDSRECYEEFFENAAEWMEYLGELFLWSLETMLDLFDLLLASLLALPITALLALLYGIQLLLYGIYREMRSTLAFQGFLFPEPEDLQTSHGRNLTTTYQGCGAPFKFPLWKIATAGHLVCPVVGVETPATAPDYNDASNLVTPMAFIRTTTFNASDLILYAQSTNPDLTRQYERQGKRIGNAIDLTAWMISVGSDSSASERDKGVAFTNWNLDSDRGYGYKAWEGTIVPPAANTQPRITSEAFVA